MFVINNKITIFLNRTVMKYNFLFLNKVKKNNRIVIRIVVSPRKRYLKIENYDFIGEERLF